MLIEGRANFDSNGGMSGFTFMYEAADAENLCRRERLCTLEFTSEESAKVYSWCLIVSYIYAYSIVICIMLFGE